MRWSFRVARIAGIDLTLHVSMLLMLPLGAMLFGAAGPAGAMFGALLVALLFGCVLLHELGHALTARAVGIPVREIQLMPLGGVAVLGRPVLNPGHELLIALMGPMVNVLIVIALAFLAIATGVAGRIDPETVVATVGAPSLDGAILWLIQANALLALFNLLPAFPLDGGRVTRAVLAFVMPYRRATVLAGALGQLIALLLGAWGLASGGALLVATAVFLFFAARQEVAATEVSGLLGAMRVGEALAERPPTLEVGQRVRDAAELMAATGKSAVAVLQGERPLGFVASADAQAALAAGRGEMWVTMAMRRQLVPVQSSDTLDAARMIMAEQNTRAVAVFEGETFRGLLTVEDIAGAFGRRQGDGPPIRPQATPST